VNAEIRTEQDRLVVRVGDWTLAVPNGTEEPLVEDEELAKRLGYARPRKLRDLIKRLTEEGKLRGVQSRPTVGRQRTRRGMREFTVETFALTEAQALKVIAKSETKTADEILDTVIAVFIAARRGLLVPADVRQMQGELHQLRAEVESLKLGMGRVVGERLARMLIASPLNEAARLTALARGALDAKAVAKARTEHHKAVRMHVQHPEAIGQTWATLPIERLGNAQAKVAEILERAKRDAAPALSLAKAVAQTSLLDLPTLTKTELAE